MSTTWAALPVSVPQILPDLLARKSNKVGVSEAIRTEWVVVGVGWGVGGEVVWYLHY